tara:strand:- start:190 stop:1467 length:1278 start_codon:yes stop_codon:yes gene_type:complete
MKTNENIDALIIGTGPGALTIAAALSKENLRVEVLSAKEPKEPWPYTYGVWSEELEKIGLESLLEHQWINTVSFFGPGGKEISSIENHPTKHERSYGLFDKLKLQQYLINQCEKGFVKWHNGIANNIEIDSSISTVSTVDGEKFSARLVIDASGYEPIFLKVPNQGPIAVQTCYGVVGEFSSPPVEEGQFVLMDYRCDHLSEEERKEPPTFLYAMDFGKGKFFLEETSLGLSPPLDLEVLKTRLHRRLKHRGIEITRLEHEELGLFLPMNIPIPDLTQPILGFGGSAGMVHPASGYLVGTLLRRAPEVARTIADAMLDKNASPAEIASKGWEVLWSPEFRRKKALYTFGLEKLMRFDDPQLRDFFTEFFSLPNKEWYGFLTNTLTVNQLVSAMWKMYKKAPWSVKWGLMGMQGRELKLLWKFINP